MTNPLYEDAKMVTNSAHLKALPRIKEKIEWKTYDGNSRKKSVLQLNKFYNNE